jgi:hypothetical protein
MADKNTLIEQMLEHLVNDDQQKAEELFHEYVVAKSRDIYENLIESEIDEESKDDEEDEEDEVEESFDEVALEADPTDDLASELDAGDDMGDEGDDDMEDKSEEELFQDLDAIVDELQAKFDELKGSEEGDDDLEMGDEEEMKDDFELETVREYVEKVPAGHGAEKKGAAEKADQKSSPVAGKNDMGGTAANIASAQEAKEASKGTAGGLAGNKTQDIKSGNVNVPGGKAGVGHLGKVSAGHGAEKKGAAESADKGAGSLFRGRR